MTTYALEERYVLVFCIAGDHLEKTFYVDVSLALFLYKSDTAGKVCQTFYR
jgi:hypothetical protein